MKVRNIPCPHCTFKAFNSRGLMIHKEKKHPMYKMSEEPDKPAKIEGDEELLKHLTAKKTRFTQKQVNYLTYKFAGVVLDMKCDAGVNPVEDYLTKMLASEAFYAFMKFMAELPAAYVDQATAILRNGVPEIFELLVDFWCLADDDDWRKWIN